MYQKTLLESALGDLRTSFSIRPGLLSSITEESSLTNIGKLTHHRSFGCESHERTADPEPHHYIALSEQSTRLATEGGQPSKSTQLTFLIIHWIMASLRQHL
jgi:hypothetical protein